MSFFAQRRRLLVTILALVAISGGVIGYLIWKRSAELPARGSPTYLEYQRAFQVGVAALEAGREELALEKLNRAVELVPEEPAGWANLGVMSLRKNALEQASTELHRAHALAPESGAIEALLGLLAEKQGRLTDAVAHYRRAVEKQPRDLASLFALADAISKEGKPGSDAEYQRLMEHILKVQPNNLPVLMQRASAAHRGKDRDAFDNTLKHLEKLAPDWSEPSRKALDELRTASKGDPGEIPPALQTLDNVLKAERSYARDARAIRPRPGAIGATIPRFLRLEPTLPSPAPADRDLMFKIEAPADGPRWTVARWFWTTDEKERGALVEGATDGGVVVRPGDLFKPGILFASADEVQITDPKGARLPFPSGPKKVPPTSAGVLPIDWDNDFRVDLVLTGAGGLRFWQQRADGSFSDLSDKTGLPRELLDGDYYGAWPADLEMDGDLDIIVARRDGAPVLLRNNRDGTFKRIDVFQNVRGVRAFVWADLDNDGAPDAAMLDDSGKLHVFANDRSGHFSPWPVPDGIGSFIALTVGDINGDGVFDLVALRRDGAIVRVSDQDQRHSWETAMLARLPQATKEATLFLEDLDNNGALDVIVSDPRETHVFLADDAGQFAALPSSLAMSVSALFDTNGDGRLDLSGLSPDGRVARAINEGNKSYRWQIVRPLANPKAGDERINSFAIGGEVELRAGALVQKQPANAPLLHFGLGEESATDVARIVWPNGVPQWEFDLPADRLILAAQRLSGSCPYLFSFDGTQFSFVGDFMWGTPLGMYVNGQNAGDFPQTTEWLKIPGDLLRPRSGAYELRAQANLWETDYFDQLALIVVDHPPDTEVFVDERFFLTPTPPRLHVTGPVKSVARAWDHKGKDATDEVRAIDRRYLDRCPRGRFQGVTRDHWVELDLGDDAPREGAVLLIARGWLHPTNSSINVALAQGKHDAPMPVVLEIPDAKGGWKATGPPIGFPAGKDKTMLIRLDGLEGNAVHRRVRLRTSMEVYWDFLGYAIELDPKLARLTRPEMQSANLQYRGILGQTQKNASSPELPHYDRVVNGGQAWRDLTGFHTRFGDVRELLAKVDDRYVIMNAGDEIALRFAIPESPPFGWKRDFIWECDGWTRDGDMNTQFGNTVLPLPAHDLKTLNAPGRLADDPVVRRFPRDWQVYHTRFVSGDDFARGLRR